MKKSERTKRTCAAHRALSLLSILLCLGPCAVFIVKAFASSALTVEKVSLTFTVFVSIIISAVCLIRKTFFKSSIWLILIGLWICLDDISLMIVITAICQTIDELVVSPLCSCYKTKVQIAKELDRRCKTNQ